MDIIENKTDFNIQMYFNKGMDKIANDAKNSTSVWDINNNRDYIISSKNCTEKTALEFLAFILDY